MDGLEGITALTVVVSLVSMARHLTKLEDYITLLIGLHTQTLT